MLVQLAGSVLVLAAFALTQWGVLNPKSVPYLALNTVGSAVLAIEALAGAQWGFLLLEVVWAAVSATALVYTLTAAANRRAGTTFRLPADHDHGGRRRRPHPRLPTSPR